MLNFRKTFNYSFLGKENIMNSFTGFTQKDFDVFKIPGFEERMSALKERISPKLEKIGQALQPMLTALTGDEMFVHVAKHLRRTVNPPKDTWVALANNKRGYKQHPHFQVGLWESHLFIWFAVIYESPIKQKYAKVLQKHLETIEKTIPKHFVWSKDHTNPNVIPSHEANLQELFQRLETVKKSEILSGITIDRTDPILKKPKEFLQKCEETFMQLEYLYRLTKEIKE
jgi:uncharacterized protein YktB (UPF0637 family)